MRNAKRFHDVFGIYATELWAMPEKEFLEWLNAKADLSTVRDESFRINKAYDDGCKTGYEQARFDYEPKWIPVTERLPKDGQDVLFCDIDEDIMLGYHVKGRPDTHFTQKGSWDEMKNVFAWMPLPEPYKGDKRMKTHDILIEDIEHMDSALERLSETRDIWQNNIVWWLCKSVRDLLLVIVKNKGGGV